MFVCLPTGMLILLSPYDWYCAVKLTIGRLHDVDMSVFAKRNAAAITQSWTRRRTQGFQSIGKCKCVWDGLQSWCSILVKSRKALKRLSWILLCEWTDPWNSWRCFTAPNSTVASLLLRCFFSLCVHFPQVMTARPRNHRAAPQKPHLAPPPSSVGS